MQSNKVTVEFNHDGFDIRVIGDYYPYVEASRDEPAEQETFEPEAIYINGMDVIGLSLLNYQDLEPIVFAQINKEQEL